MEVLLADLLTTWGSFVLFFQEIFLLLHLKPPFLSQPLAGPWDLVGRRCQSGCPRMGRWGTGATGVMVVPWGGCRKIACGWGGGLGIKKKGAKKKRGGAKVWGRS